mmetsp:Transcript_98744/g.283721  ORF Transcript_98744/g.283721 Transcript_98744/m.283721 type:complete len:263 (-) Transcript_98744:273-1061(-)
MREPAPQTDAHAGGEAADVRAGVLAVQLLHLIARRSAEDVEDYVQLLPPALRVIQAVAGAHEVGRQREARGSGEQWPALLRASVLQELCHFRVNAPGGPDVDGLGVVVLKQDELWGAVEAGGDMLRHDPAGLRHQGGGRDASGVIPAGNQRARGRHRRRALADGAGQAEITDFHRTVLVHEHIGRFQVSVVNTGSVEILQAREEIVEDPLDMGVGELDVCLHERFEVSVANFHHEEELAEKRSGTPGHDDVVHLHHVRVVEP